VPSFRVSVGVPPATVTAPLKARVRALRSPVADRAEFAVKGLCSRIFGMQIEDERNGTIKIDEGLALNLGSGWEDPDRHERTEPVGDCAANVR
jgi:hypothetical protein